MKHHTPRRSCIACRAVRDKAELLRVVRNAAGRYDVDEAGTAEGRGAYLCPQPKCLTAAVKRRALDRAFRTGTPADVVAALASELARLIAVRSSADAAVSERSPAPTQGSSNETERTMIGAGGQA